MAELTPEREQIARDIAAHIFALKPGNEDLRIVDGYLSGLRSAVGIALGRPGDKQLVDEFIVDSPVWRAML